jgi:hypothetical protein
MPSLNAEQKVFLRKKQLSASRPIDDWIAFLGPIASYDRGADRTRGRLLLIGILCIVVGLVGGAILAATIRSPYPLAIVLVGVVLLVIRAWMARTDVPNSLSGFVLPMLTLFREEVPRKSEVRLELDLRGYQRPDKQTAQSEPRSKSTRFYQDAWAAGMFPLADGNRVAWRATDAVRVRRYWKKCSSGKMKLKTKLKLSRSYAVGLQVSAKHYEVSQTSVAKPIEGCRCTVREGAKRSEIRLLSKQPPAPRWVEPCCEDLVKVIAAAYAALAPRAERKPS